MNKNEAKLQHYVPQFYLNAWAIKDKIQVVDKVRGKVFATSLRNIAGENYFNELQGLGTADSKYVETLFSKIESESAPVVKELRLAATTKSALSVMSNDDSRRKLIRFMAYQFLRSPFMRDVVGNPKSYIGQKAIDLFFAQKELGYMPRAEEDIRIFTAEEQWKKFQHIGLIVKGGARVVSWFSEMSLQVMLAKGTQEFVTSDLALLFGAESFKTGGRIQEFLLPISPKVCILLSTQFQFGQAIFVDDSIVDSLNLLHLEHSASQIYHSAKMDGNEIFRTCQSHTEWCHDISDRYSQDSRSDRKITPIWWQIETVSDVIAELRTRNVSPAAGEVLIKAVTER